MGSAEPGGFGELLKRKRTAAGLTQEELANRAGLSARAIQDLERGRRRSPHPGTARRLVEALGLQPCDVASFQTAAGPHTRHSGDGPVQPARLSNLPAELSSFVGRANELSELRRLLPTTRLLTLTGTGGVGKTRLALQVAAGLLEEATDAVWLVDLAPLADATLVPQAVAQATGIREESGRPLPATLTSALGLGRVLLIMDNCEHMVEACAQLAAHLLQTCPSLRILATSREALGVLGEVAWPVPSLQVPSDEPGVSAADSSGVEAVRLFVERATAARPGFAVTEYNAPAVAEVCRRLDGIPLAIELAAARVRVLTPEEIAARLDDRFRLLTHGHRTVSPRHQALRATIDWSYDLLTDSERRLFQQLAVFAGGFTLSAAETVCRGAGLAAVEILAHVSRLVDRSLVISDPGDGTEPTRYRLLETLRAYGLERLAERGELDQVRARHAAWITERAEHAERAFRGPEQGRWLRWAEAEHDNARAALAWALEHEDAEVAVRLAAALSWSWFVHQRWSEGLDWAQRALGVPVAGLTRERGVLLVQAIQLAVFRGDLASGRPSGDLRAVGHWIEECLALGEMLDDDELVQSAYGFAVMAREFGMQPEGMPDVPLEEVIALSRRGGYTWGECRGLEALARRALRAGDLDTAIARLNEAVQLARQTGDLFSLAMDLVALGDVERARGAHKRAGTRYEESLAHLAALGLGAQPTLVHNLGYVALASGDSALAGANFAEALGHFRRLGVERGMAECLIGFGAVAAGEGRAADAARLFGAGETALEALGTQIWPANRPDYERSVAQARRRLGARAFDRVKSEGALLGIEEATALALARSTPVGSGPRPTQVHA
ncbi:MAG TPA: helix-turn-helix domain-containing protein, partial [Chloroflexota bacterium]